MCVYIYIYIYKYCIVYTFRWCLYHDFGPLSENKTSSIIILLPNHLGYCCHTFTLLLPRFYSAAATLSLYCCHTFTLLLPHFHSTAATLSLYCCHTFTLLLPHFCSTAATLSLYCCHTFALLYACVCLCVCIYHVSTYKDIFIFVCILNINEQVAPFKIQKSHDDDWLKSDDRKGKDLKWYCNTCTCARRPGSASMFFLEGMRKGKSMPRVDNEPHMLHCMFIHAKKHVSENSSLKFSFQNYLLNCDKLPIFPLFQRFFPIQEKITVNTRNIPS